MLAYTKRVLNKPGPTSCVYINFDFSILITYVNSHTLTLAFTTLKSLANTSSEKKEKKEKGK